jgi:murein tripeptide amidase MpaA
VEAVQHENNYVPVRPDSELVAANFPDPKVALLSPAFMSPEGIPAGFNNGTTGPIDDATMKHFLRALGARNDWMTYQDSELISEEGRPIPLVFLSASPHSSAPPRGTSSFKLRIWLQGAVHGNEPAGDESLLALLGKMDANQNWTSSILSTMDIMILPRYNPDGVAYFQRRFATHLDPNRDHIKLASQQTKDIKKVFSDFSPHVAADMHEFSATGVYGGTYRHGADALFSAAKNLNIHSSIRSLRARHRLRP